MEVDAELLADHAGGIDDVVLRVEGEAGREGVQDRPALPEVAAARRLQHAVDLARTDGAAHRHVRLEMLRAEPSAGEVDDHRLDLDLRHPLGRMNGLADRDLGGFEIDDGAALEAGRALVADADDAREVRAPAQGFDLVHRLQLGDQADDLARADIEHRQGRALARGERLQPRCQALTRQTHVSTPLPRIGFFFSASGACGGSFFGEAHDDPVRHAQVDGEHVLLEDLLLALELHETRKRLRRAEFRQAHVHAVVDLQRPAAAGHERAGADAALQRAGRLEQGEVVLGPRVRLVADHERKVGEALVLHEVDDGAVRGDDEELAVRAARGRAARAR